MRKIKCRAWHKNMKCMCLDMTTDLLNRDYLIFMSWLGITDVKGTDIYEKDIVVLKNPFIPGMSCNLVGIINYNELLAAYVIVDSHNVATPICNLQSPHTTIEVLGNIYENPNLLT